MPKRRTTILGLGALAMGSGAAFTSAAFASSTEPSADFRVVVDQQLVVRGNQSPGSNVTVDGVDEDNVSNPSEYLFGGTGDVINTSNINFGDVRSDGEAAVNGEENDGLEVALAVTADESGSFDRILQVQNEGETAADVGITIAQYGSDVDVDGDESEPIDTSDVDSAFTFQIDGGTVASNAFETVDAGLTEDISIDLNLDEINESDLRSAADPGDPGSGDVFGDGAAVDTVDLVDAIEVGINGQG